MNEELATHIASLAAPIYAAKLSTHSDTPGERTLAQYRAFAIEEALKLWQWTLAHE